MRLLLLDQFSQPGGAQQCLTDLLPAFQERGWTVHAAFPGDGPLFDRVRAAGFQASRLATATGMAARQIRGLVHASRPDVVYLNGPRLLPALVMASPSAPVVFHSHSYLKRIARTAADLALHVLDARVIAACQFVARQWHRPATVIYNGVAGPPIAPARRRSMAIGCIGRIAPEKGQLEFLRAAAMIHKEVPGCRFPICGAPLFSAPAYETQVRAAAAGLPVEFCGWVNDVYAALAGLDLLLVPSAGVEATPRVVLEAHAAGVPVIAFPSGGIPELIEHGRTGWLADSVEQMARLAIDALRGGSPSVSDAARERWRRDFTVERYRRQVVALVEHSAG